jgi:hypothetical protein
MNPDPGVGLALHLIVPLTAVAVFALPFSRGLRLCLQALAVTRAVEPDEIERRLERPVREPLESVTLQMLRVLRRALREAGEGHPVEFLVDASRQYVVNEYDAHWGRPISMSANLLPPLGLIGTTAGLLALFLSKQVDSQSLELGALGLALIATIAALSGYAVLEAFKVRLYHRLLARLDDALAFYRSNAVRAPRRAEPGVVARAAQS